MAVTLLSCGSASAELIITGVVDGDLTGGNPKAILLTATADITDLSVWGVGSANNGGGTDGEEFPLIGMASLGDVIVVTGNSDSSAFFSNFDVTVFENGAANINGDDAVELFNDDLVVDTYGDIAVDGTDQDWEYSDGYAVRTGGAAGVFDIANYNVVDDGLDGLTEAQQLDLVGTTFQLSPSAIPEPSSLALLGLVGCAGFVRRRR